MPTPDVSLYYRRALILPVVLSVAGAAVAEKVSSPTPWKGESWMATVADTFAWTGFFAAVPYALFVLIVWFYFRPEGAQAHRRMAALAPAIIASSFALIFAVLALLHGDWRAAMGLAEFFGGFAFAVGTVHSLIVIGVVELVAAVVSRREPLSKGPVG